MAFIGGSRGKGGTRRNLASETDLQSIQLPELLPTGLSQVSFTPAVGSFMLTCVEIPC